MGEVFEVLYSQWHRGKVFIFPGKIGGLGAASRSSDVYIFITPLSAPDYGDDGKEEEDDKTYRSASCMYVCACMYKYVEISAHVNDFQVVTVNKEPSTTSHVKPGCRVRHIKPHNNRNLILILSECGLASF